LLSDLSRNHHALDKKVGEKSENALVAMAVHEEEIEEERDEWDLAVLTSAEQALFSSYEVLLDNEALSAFFRTESCSPE
jgi:hypothetical protein